MVHGKSPVVVFRLLIQLGLIWLCRRAGLEMVRPGWRQILAGRIDIDPALVKYLKDINRATAYAIIDYWNRSNERLNKRDHHWQGRWWSWGRDSWWVKNYAPWWHARTWGRMMDDLVEAGLVTVSQRKGEPAYSTLPYRIRDRGQLVLMPELGVPQAAVVVTEDGQRTPLPMPKKQSFLATLRKPSPARAQARDFAGGGGLTTWSKKVVGEWKTESPEVREQGQSPEGEDEQLASNTPVRENPIPPVPPAPLPQPETEDSTVTTPGETTEVEVAELRAFFTGFDEAQVRRLVKRHGVGRIFEVIDVVRKLDGIRNPPGLVLRRLGLGTAVEWTYPARQDNGRHYVTGKYAAFINY